MKKSPNASAADVGTTELKVGSSDITLPFARMEDCAAFLGVTLASLSPAIGRLEERGEIRHCGRTHFVLRKTKTPQTAKGC